MYVHFSALNGYVTQRKPGRHQVAVWHRGNQGDIKWLCDTEKTRETSSGCVTDRETSRTEKELGRHQVAVTVWHRGNQGDIKWLWHRGNKGDNKWLCDTDRTRETSSGYVTQRKPGKVAIWHGENQRGIKWLCDTEGTRETLSGMWHRGNQGDIKWYVTQREPGRH